jgi:SSS family solute:Na+ symporter
MGLDAIIIVAYFCGMLCCGLWGMRLAKTSEHFAVAGRNLGFWIYFPCLSTVLIGGGATFGSAKLSYECGISGGWIAIMYGLGLMTMGALLSSRLANLRVLSISEMLERRYSTSARYLSAIISTLYTAMLTVVQIIAIGTVLNTFLGWDMRMSMLVGGCIAIGYTLLGGMCSIVYTDIVQFILMVLGVFVFLVPTAITKVGGIGALFNAVPAGYWNPVGLGWDRLLMYFLLMYLGIMIGQDIWQRIFTARDAKTSQRGTFCAGLFSVFWGAAMGLCGMVAFVLYPNLEHSQLALASVVVGVMPTGVMGLVLAGLLSALMSSCSGQLLAAATLLINDILLPTFPGLSRVNELALSRLITALTGVAALWTALVIGDVLYALDVAYALLSGCVFIPVIAGFFWPRATARGALWSMAGSIVVTVICIVNYGPSSVQTICSGLAISALGMYIGSVTDKAPQPHPAEFDMAA